MVEFGVFIFSFWISWSLVERYFNAWLYSCEWFVEDSCEGFDVELFDCELLRFRGDRRTIGIELEGGVCVGINDGLVYDNSSCGNGKWFFVFCISLCWIWDDRIQ